MFNKKTASERHQLPETLDASRPKCGLERRFDARSEFRLTGSRVAQAEAPSSSAPLPRWLAARRRKQLLAVLAIFLVSLAFRLPFLARPLQGEHDWLTIHSLLTISIWQQVGLSHAHYSLIMNYPNEADKYISYVEKGTVMDQRGNTYFVAFPPFAFLLGFAVIHLLHLPADPIWLRIINLALLLPASFCFFLLLERMFENLGAAIASRFAMLGVALFLFDRAVLMSLG